MKIKTSKYSSFLTLVHGEIFSTKDVDTSSGLYFEETGKMFFYDREWKIVSNINLTKYRTELNNIQSTVSVIVRNCEELIEMEKNASTNGSSNEGCGPILYRLNILMADIEESDSNWFGKDTRVKRNIVTELLLDNWPDDHSSFVNEFRNMAASGSKMSTSPVKETSYISSTLNSVGKSSEINQMLINEKVATQLTSVHNSLVAARNGSVNVLRLFHLRTTIQEIISNQMLVLTIFTSKQKQYLSFMPLVGKKNVQIHNILPSGVLISELNHVRNLVSEKGLDFPMTLTAENVQFLMRLSSPEISLFNDEIFVTFQIPLISKLFGNHFTLFKVTSALGSYLSHNYYTFVVPNHDFLAIDAHKEHYTTLTVEDLNNCHQISNLTSIICKQTSPVMLTSTATDCEISVLHKREIPSTCNERYFRSNAEIFIKVLRPNSWLVTMPKVTKVRYMCEGETTQEFNVQINGLLTIGSKCKFATDNVVLTGHNTFPKSSIHEHPRGKSIKKESLTLKKLWIDDQNNIPQVIDFSENERLLRISYSINDLTTKRQVKNVSDDLNRAKYEFAEFMRKWHILLPLFILMIGLLFTIHILFIACILSMKDLKGKINQSKTTLKLSQTDVKSSNSTQPSAPSAPSTPSTSELK